MLIVSEAWRAAWPGAAAGVLAIRGAANPERHAALDQLTDGLERELRARFADRNTLRALPALQAYEAYFKQFKKTYHVLLQLESVAIKGKPIPRPGALVQAMFLAELKNQLLTAGHDLAAVETPIRLDVATGSERYVMYNGQEQTLKGGDMFIADAQGVISDVIYGPDRRTRIGSDTRDVLYTVYAPPGIGEDAVRRHLQDIQASVTLVAPAARVQALEVTGAG
jgi:DNA/RNA-binding domain of Phe-tRNA-synthetase-like protein